MNTKNTRLTILNPEPGIDSAETIIFPPLDPSLIPAEYLESFHRLDPATEDLIYGGELKEGMIVFVEASPFNVDLKKYFETPEEERSKYDEEKVEKDHRWCLVTKLSNYGEIVKFIGVYADGTKHSRMYNRSYAWFVKKDSI